MKKSRLLKIGAATLSLFMMASASAQLALDGSVVAGGSRNVRAPFGGVVEDVTLRTGDLVAVGESIANIATTRVYAPQDGMVGSVCAQEGDSAEGIIKRYGAVLYIEPTGRYTVQASTEKAYNSDDTKYVHIGEKVYLSCTKDGTHRGIAQVVKLGEADEAGVTKYTLEVLSGDFYISETVGVFRSPKYESETRIGRGVVAQSTAIAVEGAGSVLKLHVKQGDSVERGQLLFETVEGALDGLYAVESGISSDVSGIVASVDAKNGVSVAKDASLITVYPFEQLQIEAQVNVLDLGSIHEGDAVSVEFDLDPDDVRRYEGKVESISYIAEGEGAQKYYSAYISFTADEYVRVGMPAIVYLDAQEEQAGHTEDIEDIEDIEDNGDAHGGAQDYGTAD